MDEQAPTSMRAHEHVEGPPAAVAGTLPRHLIGDLWGCPPDVLRDAPHVRGVFHEALDANVQEFTLAFPSARFRKLGGCHGHIRRRTSASDRIP
jgi:hypothetical protein